MFSRKKNKLNTSCNLPSISTAPSIIVSDLNISGDLVSHGAIEIGGKVKGNVKCNNVVIRKESRVDGDIYADHLIIKGFVKGVVYADDVIIDETGVFEGQLNYKNITTYPGANVNGILNKVDKGRKEVIIDNDNLSDGQENLAIGQGASNKEEESSVNNNKDTDDEEGFEYIPSISTLIDQSDIEEKSKITDKNVDANRVDSDDKSKDTDASIESLKGIKTTKKTSILDSGAFNFTPPSNRKNKYKKNS